MQKAAITIVENEFVRMFTKFRSEDKHNKRFRFKKI